ncbi:hypothetical protein C162_30425 [Paenibacillus sp. FSL R7-269]|uniref:DUF1648 domain-containing protein n=1 Tax=Paenibacillus sp. FSL R7-269 TaxID=1226755 RepID=UPI0003E1D640|nr:DUF1648 domain-containing protein [Paenibacillus sp. FSL R7-269]ETT33950.1 hypothetical protein C162_30425 [Paenibacillus sp. FSL R7-269]
MTMLPVIVFILVFVPTIIIIVSMPDLTKETISFGVTVSAVQFYSEQLRQMRKSYARISAFLHTILFIVGILCLIYSDEHSRQVSWIIISYALAMLVISLVINFSYHLKMKSVLPTLPAAPESPVMEMEPGLRKGNVGLSSQWFLIHAVIIVVSIVTVLRNYDLIPDQLPVHFDSGWNVDRYVDKSYSIVFIPTIMQVLGALLFIFEYWSIRRGKKRVREDVSYRRAWSNFMITASFLFVILLSVVQLNMISLLHINFVIPVVLSIIAFIILYACTLTFWNGQRESRLT